MDWTGYLNAERLRPSKRETKNDPRNEFESDFGRINFSPAIRRMHDKTQVFPLTADDNIHSRLTHSMEVMSIGHSLGLGICENKEFCEKINRDENSLIREIPTLLKNACLVHDIGNPPFGHFGETVIKTFFNDFFNDPKFTLSLNDLEKQDFTLFDGNAQGLRVLTKLQVLSDPYGLNLTLGTLGTYIKYPNSGIIDKKILSQSKRGVFQSELEYFKIIAGKCGLENGEIYKRHPLAFLMEAADSICYLVMDIEDGFNKGWYTYSDIKDFLKDVEGVPAKCEYLEKEYSGYGSEIACVVNLRIHLIRNFVELARNNFIKNIDLICSGDYHHELIKDDPSGLAEKLNNFCKKRIFPKREIQSLELTGHSVLSGLLKYFTDFIFGGNKDYKKRAVGLISDSIIRAAYLENNLVENDDFDKLSDYYKLRVIVDYISGMTDQFALDQYQKLSGQKII